MTNIFYILSIKGHENKTYYLNTYGIFSSEITLAKHFSTNNLLEILNQTIKNCPISEILAKNIEWANILKQDIGQDYVYDFSTLAIEKISYSQEITVNFTIDENGHIFITPSQKDV